MGFGECSCAGFGEMYEVTRFYTDEGRADN